MVKINNIMEQEQEQNYLKKINSIIDIKGVRVCFEQALWNSSDGKVKTYYHVHVQHDNLPDLNIGVGDSNFGSLKYKIAHQIVPELKALLKINYG